MEFKISKNKLTKILNDSLRAISSKSISPILSGIKIEVGKKEIKFTTSNTELSMIVSSKDANIISTGKIVINGNYFNSIVKTLSNEEEISIKLENNKLIVSSGNAIFDLNIQNPDDFPEIEYFETIYELKVLSSELKSLIQSTIKSTSVQENRPNLMGINFDFRDKLVKASATDSHRLSQKIIDLKNDQENEVNITIPTKNINELNNFLELQDEIVMEVGVSQILFNFNNVKFISRVLQGEFPDTSRLIPEKFSTKIVLEKDLLVSSLDRAAVLAKESGNLVVDIKIENNEIFISNNSKEIGNVEEKMELSMKEGDDLEISFNPNFVKDALSTIDTKQVEIDFNSSVEPFLVKPENSYNDNLIQIVTPVRTF